MLVDFFGLGVPKNGFLITLVRTQSNSFLGIFFTKEVQVP
jgi:hypothetical protein